MRRLVSSSDLSSLYHTLLSKMKVIFLFLFSVALVCGAPKPNSPKLTEIEILKSAFDLEPSGPYHYGFETANGIVQDEVGEIKSVKDEDGKPQDVIVVKGSYSYTDPEGKTINLRYIADENGFQPEGEHIPKPLR